MTTPACNEEQGKVVSAMASAFTAQIFAVFVAFVPPLVALAFVWTTASSGLCTSSTLAKAVAAQSP